MAAVDEVTGEVVRPEKRTLGEVRTKSYRTFSPGDVIFAKITPCMENGKSAVVPRTLSDLGFGSTEFHVLRPNTGVNPRFIWHYVRQKVFRQVAEEHMTGSVGQLRVPADFLKTFPIMLPPEAIQIEIVRALDSATSSAMSAVDHLHGTRRTIEQLRQSVLAAACSGRLTSDWREANPRIPVAPGPELSSQARSNASGSPNTSDLVEVPSTWAWWSVEGITERVIDYRGRTPPSQPSGPIPHVRTTQIQLGHIDWNVDRFITQDVYDKYMTRGIPQRDDVLFTMEAPMGEVGIVDRDEPFSIAQRILLLRPGAGLTGEFLSLALQSQPVRRAIEYRATGSGVMGIAYKRLRSVVLPKPPLDEQLEIVRRAVWLLEISSSLESRIKRAEHAAGRTSQAVLAKAFRGELLPVSAEATAQPGAA